MRHSLLRSTLVLASLAVTLFVIAIVVFPTFFGISAMPAGEGEEAECGEKDARPSRAYDCSSR